MIWYIVEKQLSKDSQKNAGGKARTDLNTIFSDCGYAALPIEMLNKNRDHGNLFKKIKDHFDVLRIWEKALDKTVPGDTVLLQFPVINHSLFLTRFISQAKKKNVKTVAFIHDLELLRNSKTNEKNLAWKFRIRKEEIDELKLFDYIVVHNEKMKSYVHERINVPLSKMIVLELFDYLAPHSFCPKEENGDYKRIVIAGNLDPKKSGYVYQLPSNCDFELYGINYRGEKKSNERYHGSFLADELPLHLKGGFGLIWDGNSTETCSGVTGDYLRFNNPHKTSLYLCCGIPVIIWSHAALADFVIKNEIGFTIDSINDLNEVLEHLSIEQYKTYKRNALKLSSFLRSGGYTKRVLNMISSSSH